MHVLFSAGAYFFPLTLISGPKIRLAFYKELSAEGHSVPLMEWSIPPSPSPSHTFSSVLVSLCICFTCHAVTFSLWLYSFFSPPAFFLHFAPFHLQMWTTGSLILIISFRWELCREEEKQEEEKPSRWLGRLVSSLSFGLDCVRVWVFSGEIPLGAFYCCVHCGNIVIKPLLWIILTLWNNTRVSLQCQ